MLMDMDKNQGRGNMLLHPQDLISSKDSAVKKVPWISSSASNQKQLSENAGTKFVIAYDVGETTYYCFVDDRLLATLTALFLAELSKKDNAFLLGTPSDELKKFKISCDELSVTDLSEPLIWYITGSGSDTGSSPSKMDVNSLNSQSHPNKQLISAEVDASVCSGSSMSVDVVSSSHMVGCDLIPVFLSCHSKKSFFQVAVMVRAEFLSANSFAEFSPRVIQLIKSLGFPVEDDCLVGYEVKLPSLVSDYFVLPDCHKSAVVKLNRVVVHQD